MRIPAPARSVSIPSRPARPLIFISATSTPIYISDINADGLDIAAWFATWDDAGNPADRGVVVPQAVDGSATLIARVSGAVVDAAGFSAVPVTVIMAAGSFTLGPRFGVLFSAAGTHGTNSTNGVNPGLQFAFSSATAMADPGVGAFRLNNAAPAAVTAIAVDDLSSLPGNPDVSAVVLAWPWEGVSSSAMSLRACGHTLQPRN